MSRPWDSLNEAATVAQLSGMDAITLISMILQLLRTFHSNDEEYMQLEQRVKMLQILPVAEMMMQHQAIREVMQGLEDTLRDAYMLLRSFRDSSVTYRIFMGWKQARHLRQVQEKIDRNLELLNVVIGFENNRLLHLKSDSIQGTTAIATAADTATTMATAAGVHFDTATTMATAAGSDVDGDIVGTASPQPGPQQPDLSS